MQSLEVKITSSCIGVVIVGTVRVVRYTYCRVTVTGLHSKIQGIEKMSNEYMEKV